MKQNEKDLLVKDLCARLPYGVKFACNKNIYTAKGLDLIVTDEGDWEYAVTAKGITPIEIDFIKPCLFPISSMTKEQKKEYAHILAYTSSVEMIQITGESTYDWLNKNMFDWRGLIPMGLANDATGLNIY
jgi:hypothetical protein